MNIARGTICGVICGLAGAAVWAGVAYGTGYENGWIAWGVGLLAGIGFAWGSQGSGMQAGIIAAFITIIAIVVGKYATIELYIHKEMGSKDKVIQQAKADLQEDDLMISYLADEVAYELESRGEKVEWPFLEESVTPCEEQHYPTGIWAQAKAGWESMSPEERVEVRSLITDRVTQNIHDIFTEASSEGFSNSFSGMDVFFFLIAIATAYQIASTGRSGGAEPEPDTEQNPPAEGE